MDRRLTNTSLPTADATDRDISLAASVTLPVERRSLANSHKREINLHPINHEA